MSGVSVAKSKFIAKKLNEEAALVFLASMIVGGKKSLDDSYWLPSDCTLEFFSKVKDDKFFQPFFLTSIKMALMGFLAVEKKITEDVKEITKRSLEKFQTRLKEIFPDYFAKRLFEFVCRKWQENIKLIICSKEELNQRIEYARSILEGSLINNSYSRLRPFGTNTWIVSCPRCKTEKRCDANTKNFRCKCGFEKSYPFE